MRPSCSAAACSAMIEPMRHLVLATAISGPTRISTALSASLVACEPGVLQIVSCAHPARRASSIAARVSTVSPDWPTEITSVRSSSTGRR